MNSKKNLKRNLLICLLAGSAVMYTLPLHAATSVIANNTLPQNGQFVGGSAAGSIVPKGDLQLDVSQKYQNAVIKWDSFDVGGSATVNFSAEGAYANNFNTLNYINSGAASQIYGTINASGGNIYIVNPAGVQIGNSAQINVGSLHVSNKNLDDAINKLFDDASKDETGNFYQTIGLPSELMANSTNTDAVLMSLGNINAGKVTFEGDGRIVIDSERLKDVAGTEKLTADKIFVNTKDKNNVVIGYEAYDKTNGYKIVDTGTAIATVNDAAFKKENGYMWVEDVKQLQAINTNLGGNYALRNSIDATSTATAGNSFISIGSDNNAFIGKFDGIDYNIFGLTIDNNNKSNTGLFGETNGATINNVTLVGGKITGGNNTGALVGHAINSTITNVVNSAEVNGDINVGGFIGASTNSIVENAVNTGSVHSDGGNDNKGGIVSSVGGLIGSMTGDRQKNSQLTGNSYNLGNVSGNGYNVGGLVGHAVNSTIGDGTNLVYNRLDVTGAYNVGGIVGNMKGSTVQYAENSGTVLATGHTTEDYIYHTAITLQDNIPNGGRLDDAKDIAEVIVDVANVGGIAGTSAAKEGKASKITNVTNSGDVSSSKVAGEEYYAAGNVGGVVGRAEDTDITNATNKENDVRGAHNVGGIAGYFGSSKGDETGENVPRYTVTSGINDGGDIMATGARRNGNFVQELVRRVADGSNEKFTVGNIGGVVGYMDGYNVYVTGSANRGTVHTSEPADPKNVKDWEKAANVGGIVGKIDRSDTKGLTEIKNNTSLAAVNNSYNTGDVLGYTGVGGVVGMMYNGEVAGSYNLGYISTTRQSTPGGSIDALNMGGVVGDTTENANAKGVVIYDVYNKGQIGDSEFNYYGRHVGGIVGRLSGTVEKAYNNGAIYNGYNVVGGIAGWMAQGKIENAFNTGNITVLNKNNAQSQVGGIVGAANVATESIEINNVYNLGTLRSFRADSNSGVNTLGGIIGQINDFNGNGVNTFTISNAYTTGNLMMYKLFGGSYVEDLGGDKFVIAGTTYTSSIGSIYGLNTIGGDNDSLKVENTYYIRPQDRLGFTDLAAQNVKKDNSNKPIDFDEKSDLKQYHYYDNDGTHHSLTFTQQEGGKIYGSVEGITTDGKLQQIESTDTDTGAWRIYGGNTPILNAFLPDSEKYFENGLKDNTGAFTGTIQYGTAYDPLLTIINTNRDLSFVFGSAEAGKLSITNAAGLAVYGGGVTLNNFTTSSGSGYFGGTIYADGALNINGVKNDIGIGSAADIYGSAVNITTDGKVTIYGDVTATGNGTKAENNPDTHGSGSITITASDVDVYGTLTSASNTQGANVTIPGIEDSAVTWTPGNIKDPYASMSDIADRFAHTTGASAVDGNITINANGTWNDADNDNIKDEGEVTGGNVNLYFGNKEQGLITTGGDLQVEATGNIFVDSDLDVGGNLKLTSTGKNSEILLTLTNIGKVQADKFTGVIENFLNGKNIADINANDLLNVIQEAYPGVEFTNAYAERIVDALTKYEESGNKASAIEQLNNDIAVAYMHQFMHNFDRTVEGSNKIYFNADSGNAKLTVDMWDYDQNTYNFWKYDTQFDDNGTFHTFKDELDNLDLHVNDDTAGVHANASEYVYVEVSTGEQLKAIQNAGNEALGYNYALMSDINASGVNNYEAIGTGSNTGFTGTFDGRGNRIIGLTVDTVNGQNIANAGIFSTVGEGGVVKDLNIYSGTFTGSDNAGAVAGVNNGRIEGIVTFGNTVTVTGDDGNAGGIVGINNAINGKIVTNEDGTIILEPVDKNKPVTGIIDVESTGSVIAGNTNAIAGGLVGTNNGTLGNSYSNSAVTANAGTAAGLGGVVGVNTEKGNVQYVDSLGVTNGGATNSSNIGGIIGTNNGNMYSGYNESIVSGKDNVGGIIGENSTGGTVTNIVNATSVTGENESADNVSQYVGGLVGSNSGSVTNGRNNGTITGTNYVGGMVGINGENSTLTNLVNDSSAAITGEQYVGGIAGYNAGTITTGNQETDKTVNLINRGTITGQQYVGGVAGSNSGTITNANNDVELNVKDSAATDDNAAKYFGGIAGENTEKGIIKNATNTADVNADGATYVGGIVGKNDGTLENMAGNSGNVTGKDFVGGVAGLNNKDIDGVNASNTGVVKATEGGAGGIFAENTGDITNSTLTNNKIVAGTGTTGATGGIIGKNSGDISSSSLKNEVGGQVIGVNNVGGLIGINTGTIKGGRTDANSNDVGYYKYQIYNNGVINVGTWNDTDSDGVVDTGEIQGLKQGETSQNIGGLIGNNTTENGKTGSLTAGYNTGAINASGSTNVGGIAGSNAGIIGEVFNTVMTADGQNQTITGGTNVGGLVGNNSGTLSNAYNTTEVKGNANVGTIIGNNATNNVSNVYNTWDTENSKLISTGNSADNAYNIDSNKQTDYSGLDFNDTWKIYEGNSNPLLKVFLTNLTIKDINNEGTSLKEFLNLVYNGKEQDLNIKALIDNGFIVVPDEEALKAYHNTLIGNNLGESYLINNTDGQKTAGKHNNWLYSEQIHVNTSGEFNPNNLGYDITFANNDKGILEIDKAKLTITLDDIYRIYGQEGLKDGYEYGFSIDGLADSDKNLANDIIIEEGTIEDGALVDINNDGKVTNDVNYIDNPYKWTADVTLSDYIEQNYNILYDGGNSHVTKADLTITADNKETMPGVMPDFTGTDIQQGLVNGDSAGIYDYNLDGSVNIDVDGTYTDKIGISFDNGETYYDLENVDWSTIPGWDFLKNYDINFKPGTLIVSSELLPDIPSDWPHNRWDYLFNDAPFDRTKDFRERKAEINFVDGGMEI